MTEILHSKIVGFGEKHLLIFHGLFGQLDNWSTLGKQFGEHFTTHLIDLRNHGRSFHSEDSSLAAMTQDVVNYMEAHSIEKAHLLGHSLGGRIVIDFAMIHQNRLDYLIVADMAPKAYQPHHNAIFKALKSVDFDQVETRKDVEKTLEQYIPEMGVRQFLLKNVYHADNGQYAFRFNLDVLDNFYQEMIGTDLLKGEFDGPTLFLGGAKSNYIMPEDEMIICERFPNAEIKKIANAGHWLHAENPKDFTTEVLNFLLDK
ncbi:alpha/beta fold hydrolase [Empedobacter stercoris]|uniref:alpha/beta fold hydrolase n=1 Tax=Empedobacter stercoris TaxID=1628248 RepID=UPI001CE138CD|nr:alpha/beta fold hydrolase [Empedobacter stercoris]MCA4782571.1 alpha/beta fold hydrolase [Empedobacter stercoris]